MKYLPEGSLFDTFENRTAIRDVEGLRRAMETGTVLEARAAAFDCRKNLLVPLGEMQGIIPYHECAMGIREGTTRDIAILTRVGRPVSFVVVGFSTDETGAPVAVLSRRIAQLQCRANYLDSLRPGDVIPCTATHTEAFGCFADVGCGISALLPIDAISVSRIGHPSERIRTGDRLRCVVRSRDEQGRLVLSLKEMLGTWAQNAALFTAGETVMGVARSVEPYGVFVELAPNLAGLAERCERVREGDGVSVYIKSILPQRMKIKLVIVDTFPRDPQPAALRYFFEGSHMDEFLYSPADCDKRVHTVFGEEGVCCPEGRAVVY